MIRTAALAIVLAGLSLSGTPRAAGPETSRGDLYITLFGAAKTPDISSADGQPRAFMCLASDPAAPTQDCFMFMARPESIRTLKLSNGGSITRSGDAWIEAPGGFHFAQKSLTPDRMVIADATRGITWTIDLQTGATSISSGGKSASWYQVTGLIYDLPPQGYVAAPKIALADLRKQPARPQTIALVFTRKINPLLRTDLYAVVNNWNAKTHPLTAGDCLDLFDAVAATIGVRRPPHASAHTAAEYVTALAKLNP